MTANFYIKIETSNKEDRERIKAARQTLQDIKNALDKVDGGVTSDYCMFREMIGILDTILDGGVLG